MLNAQPPGFGPPGFGPGGPGGPGAIERKVLKQFDSDENGWLNSDERKDARAFLKENPSPQGGFGRGPGGGRGFGPPPGFGPPDGERPPRESEGPGGPGRGRFGGPGGPGFGPPSGGPLGGGPPGGGPPGMGRGRPEVTEGEKIEKSSVQPLQAKLYDNDVLRTIFIDFEDSDWEKELEEFHGTDVDVAARLTVDGKPYENCGIHFRGMSSYGMIPAGYKRSLNVSLDLADDQQRLLGYKTLNLLNGSGDESMMSAVLYSHIAQQVECQHESQLRPRRNQWRKLGNLYQCSTIQQRVSSGEFRNRQWCSLEGQRFAGRWWRIGLPRTRIRQIRIPLRTQIR